MLQSQCFALLVAVIAVAAAQGKVLWGKCDKWDRDRSGCQITSGHKCTDHLSPGPEKSTIEIVLGNLPASKSANGPGEEDRPVHLQWFAPREAKGYNPVGNIHRWTVHRYIGSAYPKYTDPDFNGGNVRVNETGHAVVRFQAPATYVICRNRIRYPHIHLRLCVGDSYLIDRAETVDFTLDGPRVHACGVAGAVQKYTILSFRNIGKIPALSSNIPPFSTKIIDATSLRKPKPPLAPRTTLVATTATVTTTSTSTSISTTTSTLENLIADESYDWDALEFSPVYQCLLDNQVYDHFSSACVDSCPAHAGLKHGQCVRKATDDHVEFSVSWTLQVHCDEACWNAKTSRTRHDLRLATADHLDIPFQEILKVVLRPSSRRLDGRSLTSQTLSGASLHVSVNTSRQDATTGMSLLRSFMADAKTASQLLGLEVHSIKVIDGTPEPVGKLEAGEESDEFAPLYSEFDNDRGAAPVGTSPTDGLPTVVIIAGAAAVVVFGVLTAGVLWYKRRRQANMAQDGKDVPVAKGIDVEGEKVGVVDPDDKGNDMVEICEI